MRLSLIIFIFLMPFEVFGESLAPIELSPEVSAQLESLWESKGDDGYVEQANPSFDTIWNSTTLPVCWENPTAGNLRSRLLVQNAVEETWQLNSGLNFTYWGQCQSNSLGIRILTADAGPHVKRLGNGLDGIKDGMVLNDTFQNWSPVCQGMWRSCVYSIAVHEFGHALGFAHEQNRRDTPNNECFDKRQGSDGSPAALTLTPWDINSVMNYCNPAYNNKGELSNWDVFALRKLYENPDG